MVVSAHPDAIKVDFRTTTVRRDLGGDKYLPRPGFHLPDVLARYRADGRSVVLLNGNNVGYWGNQFVIENGEFRYKRRGPLFDDGQQLRLHATGDHAFFFGHNGYRITNLAVAANPQSAEDTGSDFRLDREPDELPRFGLSGFPLLRNGQAIWRDHAPLAWDPALLFEHLGSLPRGRYDYTMLRSVIEELVACDAPLARHPMTVIGLDQRGDIVLLVVERSQRSPGMTVDEAAVLLSEQYRVRDAIVLGAAGDAQLATTHEGLLVEPWVTRYAKDAARPVRPDLVHPALRRRGLWARPVPSYVAFLLSGPVRHRHVDPAPDSAQSPRIFMASR